MPADLNPTTPAVDVAEGRRLWENAKAALAAEKAYEISNVQCYETVALYQAWAFDNAEALLTAASERDAAVRALTKLVGDVDALISESGGVYGLHLNGDPAPWDSLTQGGQFETWLLSLEEARALASVAQGGAK